MGCTGRSAGPGMPGLDNGGDCRRAVFVKGDLPFRLRLADGLRSLTHTILVESVKNKKMFSLFFRDLRTLLNVDILCM